MKRRVMLVVYLFLIALFSFFIFWDYENVLGNIDDVGVPDLLDSSSSSSSDEDDNSLCGNTYCDDNAGEDGISCPSDCVTQCNDGVDNDGDGDVDNLDSGCVDGNDNLESTSSGGGGGSSGGSSGGGSGSGSSCGDGTCDSGEDGISCPSDCVTQCNDGIDNDNDTLIDFPEDDGCFDLNDNSEAETGISTDGLIAYYDFENDVLDSSGSGYDGVNNLGTFDADAKTGSYSLSLNGASSYVSLPSNIALNGNQATIAFWFKANNVGDYGRFISKADGLGVKDDNHWWMVSLNQGQFRGRLKTLGSTSKVLGGSLSTGIWTHGAMIYDGSEMRLYLDGSKIAMQSKTGTIDVDNTLEVWVGANPGGTDYYDGLMDDLRIYDRVLTDGEIASLAGTSSSGSTCGDSVCDAGENPFSCSSDCGTYVCSDGLDNDGDGWTDLADPGCVDGYDTDETNGDLGYQCSDGSDNDEDGLIDGNDLMCSSWNDNSEATECSDGLDNDGDGFCDWSGGTCTDGSVLGDSDCSSSEDNSESGILGCPNGKPGPSNTGPLTPKSQLTPYTGPMTITSDGTIIEGVYITGTLKIKADNVILRDFVIECGDGEQSGWPYYCLQSTWGNTNLLIEDGEMFGAASSILYGSELTMKRVELHTGGSDAIKVSDNTLLEDNWIHHPIGIGPGAPHADGIQMRSGNNNIFKCNNLDIPIPEIAGGNVNSNACFIIQTAVGNVNNLTIESNWCNGGNYATTIGIKSYALDNGYVCPTNIQIRNNKFGNDCRYGLYSSCGPTISCGNTWEASGAFVDDYDSGGGCLGSGGGSNTDDGWQQTQQVC